MANLLHYFSEKGLDHIAENILSYLDADSLFSAELVSKEWNRVISEGMLWKKLIERKVRSDSLWRGLAERKKWIKYLFVPRPGEHRNHSFYRTLYPLIMKVSTVLMDFGNGDSFKIIQKISRKKRKIIFVCIFFNLHKYLQFSNPNFIFKIVIIELRNHNFLILRFF